MSYESQTVRARITLYAPAKLAAERIPPALGTLEESGGDTCVLRTGASSLDTLSVYLALIGFDFKVHEPPELVERVRYLADRFTRAGISR